MLYGHFCLSLSPVLLSELTVSLIVVITTSSPSAHAFCYATNDIAHLCYSSAQFQNTSRKDESSRLTQNYRRRGKSNGESVKACYRMSRRESSIPRFFLFIDLLVCLPSFAHRLFHSLSRSVSLSLSQSLSIGFRKELQRSEGGPFRIPVTW